MMGRGSSRKARHGEIEAAPEEVDGADFAEEAGAKLGEDTLGLDQDAPETPGVLWVVGVVLLVLSEGNGVGQLDRHGPNFHLDAEVSERSHDVPIKVGDGLGTQGHPAQFPLRRLNA